MLAVTLWMCFAGVFVAWLYYRITRRHMIDLVERIPGPKAFLLLGNLLDVGFLADLEKAFQKMLSFRKEFGEVYRIWSGPEAFIVISGAEYVEVLLSNFRQLDKACTYKYVEPWLGSGLLTATGSKWKAHRKLIATTFHLSILEKFVDVFNSHADVLVKKLKDHIDGPEFDIFPYLTHCSLDVICETIMGVSVSAQEDANSQYVRAVRSVCDCVMSRSLRAWLYVDLMFNLSVYGRVQRRCLDILHSMTQKVIETRKKEFVADKDSKSGTGKRRLALLDMLIKSQDGTTLTDKDIREEVDTFMFAGHDTTSSSLSFTCWLLANHPDVQEKVIMEQEEILGSSVCHATFQQLQEMKYLERVIKESLRLYPSVTIFGRKLTHDLRAGSYTFPAGSNILVSTYPMHRDPKYFRDPEKFDPDRFLPENISKVHPYSYIPFSAGPRNCIGQKFALFEMKAVLSRMLKSYQLLPGTIPLNLTHEIILNTTKGSNIRLRRRNNQVI